MFSKAELDACHVVDKDCTDDEYKKLTAVQKQKLWVCVTKTRSQGLAPPDA